MMRSIGFVALLTLATGCMPRLSPLVGEPQPASRLPKIGVAPGHSHIVFNWELEERDITGRGEGVARVASPDSARLDFFLAGGFGNGAAVLIGDSLRTPGGDMIRKVKLYEYKYNDLPYKFEAGTPAIAEAFGLARRRGL